MKQTLSLHGRLISQFDHDSMSILHHLWDYFKLFAGDVCCVAIQDWSLARMDLTRVIKDDHLPY